VLFQNVLSHAAIGTWLVGLYALLSANLSMVSVNCLQPVDLTDTMLAAFVKIVRKLQRSYLSVQPSDAPADKGRTPHVRSVVTFRVSRRRRQMYCGHARLCVCLSVRGRMATLLGCWTTRGYANSRIANSRTGQLADASGDIPCLVFVLLAASARPRVVQSASWQSASWLSASCPVTHYCTDPDVTWGSGSGCPLVVHYWADLQSVHGLRCYGNVTRTQNVSEYMLVYSLYA